MNLPIPPLGTPDYGVIAISIVTLLLAVVIGGLIGDLISKYLLSGDLDRWVELLITLVILLGISEASGRTIISSSMNPSIVTMVVTFVILEFIIRFSRKYRNLKYASDRRKELEGE